MTAWLVVLAIGVGTFLTRLSFIALFGRTEVPEWLPRALRYVPPAVLAALALPAVTFLQGDLALSLSNVRLAAAVIAGAVGFLTRNAIATISSGMVALWILQAINQ